MIFLTWVAGTEPLNLCNRCGSMGRFDDGVELVVWSGEIELKLTVLIDRADTSERCQACAVFSKTLSPKLPEPEAKAQQTVII